MVAVVSSAQAATVGYWRFEDSPGYLEDSSTYNNDLTTGGTPTHYTLPATGNGADFDNPIPQTNAANAKAVDLDGNAAQDYYYCVDQTEFAVSDFTIEAYVRKVGAENQMIASQFNYSLGNQRSWGLFVRQASDATYPNELGLFLSEDGTGTNTASLFSGLEILTGVDYFVAATFDQSDQTTGVKFYVKNLSTGTWQTTVTMAHNIDSLHDSTGNFDIGAINNGGASNYYWDGVIDEVRFSDTVLGQNDLLAVPEPATMTLLLLGLPFALRRRRK